MPTTQTEPQAEAQPQTEEQTEPQDKQPEQPQPKDEQTEPQAEAQPQTEEQTEPQDQQPEQPQPQEEQPEPQAEAQPQIEEQTEPQDKQPEQPQPQEDQPEPQAETQPQTEEQSEPQAEEKTETPDNKQTDPAKEDLDQQAPAIDASQQQIADSNKNMATSPAVSPGDLSHVSLTIPAKEIMQTQLQWLNPDDSVQTATNMMQQNNTGYLLVGNDGEVEGIVSNSDIASALSPYLKPVFSKWRGTMDDATLNIKVKWIMSKPVHTVKPETSLQVMIESMQQFQVRCLPVVDPQKKALGMVTVFDIFKLLTSN